MNSIRFDRVIAVWSRILSAIQIKSGKPGRSMSVGSILWSFLQDTFLTGAIFVTLVMATHVLKASAATLRESPTHFQLLELLEHGIFFSGCLMLALVALFVTIIGVLDLFTCFFNAIRELAKQKGNEAGDA